MANSRTPPIGSKGKKLRNLPIRPCTPGDVETIARLRARGRTWLEVAEEIKVPISTVLSWYDARIKPVWQALTGKHTHEEIARLNELERECWRQYERSVAGMDVPMPNLKALKLDKAQKRAVDRIFDSLRPSQADKAWLTMILAIIDLRARLRGDFAPTKSHLSVDASVRVAGSTPAAVNDEMMGRLMARVKEIKNYEAAAKMVEGSEN